MSGLRILSLAQVSGCQPVGGIIRWIDGVMFDGKNGICFRKHTECKFSIRAQQVGSKCSEAP